MINRTLKPDTLLTHAGRSRSLSDGAVNVPVVRASTRLYPNLASYEASRVQKFGEFRYGRYGTPTTFALEEAMAALEGGWRAAAVPSGLAAITGVLRALVRPGDHVLVVDTVYGPVRTFCDEVLHPQGIEVTFYDPLLGEDIENCFRERTRLVYCESPGSLTFEVQDIPAIARAAHKFGIVVVADNTWATPYFFRAFDHGVDISIHAATKYIVGHSDAMLGLIVTNEKHYAPVRSSLAEHGAIASPDDCWLALRGLRTLGVRLRQHHESALRVALWLKRRPEVVRVLYPALPEDAGHGLWQRDFRGATGLFGIELRPEWRDAVPAFVDALTLFGIGSSWGGYESLILPSKPVRTTRDPFVPGPLLRLHIGLEDPEDLIADLEHAFDVSASTAQEHLATA